MDNEVFINANGATDRGLQYGSKIELEVGSGNGNTEDATIDEVALFFSSGWGRIELGREDGAEDVMGDRRRGCSGRYRRHRRRHAATWSNSRSLDTGDDAKVTYFTPRIVGFQLGGSFVPDSGNGI